jgi:hypothetical protein
MMKKCLHLLTVTVLILLSARVNAQSGFSAIIKAAPYDATKLVDAYGQPLFKGLGVGLNSGWNNTAKTKKLLHFELRVTASAAFVPNADKTFDVTKIGLSSNVRPDNPNQTIAPTFAGNKNTTGPLLDIYDDNGRKISSFNMPSGKLSVIPAPQIQLTVGLIQNTDLTIRAIPSINLGSDVGKVSSIGFGLKHNIMQDIVGKTAGKLVPFDLSIAVGYSHLNLNIPLDVEPDYGTQPENANQSTNFSNQHISGTFNSFMGQLIISKKLLAFTPFLAIGYNTTHTNVGVVGNYPVTTGVALTGTPTYTTYPNPVNISETSISGARADLGFQLVLGFFRLYASGSLAQYKSVNAGIGFGF